MSFYKFGQVTISSKEFYEAVVIDIKTLNIANIVVSDPITDNKNGKRYIIGYNIDGKIVALRIKTPKNIYSYGVSKYTESSKWCMSFNLEAHDESHTSFYVVWPCHATEKAYRYVQQKNIIIYQTCPRKKPSFWSNIELSRRRKGRFIFSSGISKGKVKKLEEEREQTKETLES